MNRHFAKENTQMANRCRKVLNITALQRNANQNPSEISPHTCQNGQNQKHEKRVSVRLWRERNPPALLLGRQTGAAAVENGVQSPQKSSTEQTSHQVTAPMGDYPKTDHSKGFRHRYVYSSFTSNNQPGEAAQGSICR